MCNYSACLSLALLPLAGCSLSSDETGFKQSAEDLLEGQVMAIAYSGFREGQHPDRGDGAINPSEEETLEDLKILENAGFGLIRLYDCDENSQMVLEVIQEKKLPIKVLLGIWLDAEISNHQGCEWLTEPIAEEKLLENTKKNMAEVQRGIELANTYTDVVVAVNVGNEALVSWNDHMVTLDSIIAYVRQVKAGIEQPVTVADNYEWWIQEGAPLAAELDFIGVHTYPAWENKPIEEGLSYTIQNIEDVHAALPDSKIAILEAGWATTGIEFGDRASEDNQLRHYNELKAWATSVNTTVFFFEAFDEPWKGHLENVNGAEKHWGIYFVDRTPKKVMQK